MIDFRLSLEQESQLLYGVCFLWANRLRLPSSGGGPSTRLLPERMEGLIRKQ
jgi:hypothetical protein